MEETFVSLLDRKLIFPGCLHLKLSDGGILWLENILCKFLIGSWPVFPQDGHRKGGMLERRDEVYCYEVVLKALERYFSLFVLAKGIAPIKLAPEDVKMKWGMALSSAKLPQSNDITCLQGFGNFLNSCLCLFRCHFICFSV
jgi:hypothetical protein